MRVNPEDGPSTRGTRGTGSCLVACVVSLPQSCPRGRGPCPCSCQDSGVEPRVTVHSAVCDTEGRGQHCTHRLSEPWGEHLEPCMSAPRGQDFTCWPLLGPPGPSPEQRKLLLKTFFFLDISSIPGKRQPLHIKGSQSLEWRTQVKP